VVLNAIVGWWTDRRLASGRATSTERKTWWTRGWNDSPVTTDFLLNSIRTPKVGEEFRSLTPAELLRGSSVGAGFGKEHVWDEKAEQLVAVFLNPTHR